MLISRLFFRPRTLAWEISRWASLLVFLIGFLLSGIRLSAAQVDPSIPPDVLRDFETLRRQLEQSPRDVGILNSLGIVYARAGQVNDAMSVWKRALEIDPRYIHLYNNIGSALKTQKRFVEAREVFQRGLRVAPSYWIHYNLGLLEKEIGHSPEAIRSFQECLKLNRTFEPAQQKLFELRQQPGMMITGVSAPGLMPPPVLPFPFDVKPPVAIQNEECGTEEEPASERPPRVLHPAIVTGPVSSVADCVALLSRLPAGSEPRLVALTFDDGPHSDLTPRLLNYLRTQGAKATFFVIGSRAETYPDLISRMVAEGHEVGNHTWSHRSLVNAGPSTALADLKHTSDLLNGLPGGRADWFVLLTAIPAAGWKS